MTKKKEKSDIDCEIVRYLKKNRTYSKFKQCNISKNDIIIDDYIITVLDGLVGSGLNNVIVQNGIRESHVSRFCYTPDNFTIIITNENRYDEYKEKILSRKDKYDFELIFFDQ